MERALAYQGRLTRSAVRGGLAAVANLLSRELHCEVVVLDEYGAAIGSSTKEGPLLELINQEWRQLRSHTRRGTVGIEVQDGVLEGARRQVDHAAGFARLGRANLPLAIETL